MSINWITIIAVLLLVLPLLFGLWRGLPDEVDKLKYTIYSIYTSIIWLLSYGAVFWLLRQIVMGNTFSVPQMQWLQQQLQASIVAWVIAVPVCAILLAWLMRLITGPAIDFLAESVHHIRNWTEQIPKGTGRIVTVLFTLPKAILRTLLFFLILHFGLPYFQVPKWTEMAEESFVYQWTDKTIINPVLASSWSKQLPVLGQQTKNWFHQISQEAAKYGPEDSKSFWTWQTRFDSNEQIDATAKKLVKGAKTDREKAYRLYKWIGENIAYDDSKALAIQSGRYRSLTYGAIPTYQTKTGICSDYSALMVAMGRAVGLEVKQELGEGVLPNGTGGPHAWNVVHLKDENKQIPCDPTWEHAGNYFDNRDFYHSHHPEKTAL